ncbi:MAG: lamin tail domain-containing protein [Bacteroidaceae bacterium]|nr:lamin tail domain-containing protein [Bacteroidaceae bacterium]
MNSKKLFGLLLLAWLALPLVVQGQDWIDLTDAYIVNPRFDNNNLTTGWQGTPFGMASPHENAEHYSRDFDSYQVVNRLKPGTYRLSLNAFYRSGGAQDDYNHYRDDAASYQLAQLYASSQVDEYSTPIALAGSGAVPQGLGGATSDVWTEGGSWWGGEGERLVVPNNMDAAYYWFQAGHYHNVLTDIVVGADGELVIGIRKTRTIGSDWICLDDWKLEYYGAKVDVTGLQLSDQTLTLQFGETYTMEATVLPADATIRTYEWLSSDESVAKVDAQGNITTKGKGTCTIYAFSKDNPSITAACTVTVERDAVAPGSLVINEIQSKNVDMFMDPSFNYGGWIELYNPTDKAISLGGFYVSDDPNDLKKYHLPDDYGYVPAKGFRNIWFDHNSRYGLAYRQVNTKLDCDGGEVCVSDYEGNLIVSLQYPAGIGRASWARSSDGSPTWGWTANPTPEKTNVGCDFSIGQLAAPEVDTNGCLFDEGQSLTVTVTIPSGAKLRYTTDGTTPTETHGTETTRTRFTVKKTTTYRWRLFQTGKLPSPVTTRSYIMRDKDYTLPVVSIVTDPDNLYSDAYGVDVPGLGNGRSGNGTNYAVNYNMDWDRPVSFEYIEQEPKTNTDGYFQQEADFSISGGWSRKQTPRSFKIKATKTYDLNSLDYRFFDDAPYSKNKVLLFRNGGNDGHAQSRIKDAAIHRIVKYSGLYCDLQDWNPTHVFVNGKYRGMENMRQPSNKHLAYAAYGIDTDEIDAFEMSVDSGYVQSAGTREKFEEWYALSANAQDDAVYAQLCDLVDMDEYCNYMAIQFNLQNWDWPHNNLKGFRERRDGAKFHMTLFDVDNVFEQNIGNPFTAFKNRKTYTFYPIFEWNNKQLTLEVEHVTIFLNLLKNPTFRKKFIDTYCLVNGSVFEPSRCAAIIDEMRDILLAPMGLEGYSRNLTEQANTLKDNFSESRQQEAITYIREFGDMALQSIAPQTVSLASNIEGGRLLLNGMTVPTGQFHGGLFAPVTLKAEAPAGYRFLGWESDAVPTETTSTNLFGFANNWRYFDQGSLDGQEWMEPGYSDQSWPTGRGGFGYNLRNGEVPGTTLDYGGNDRDKRPTYYFRKLFTLSKLPAADSKVVLTARFDDGYILYVNGEEVALNRLSSGAGYGDFASAYGPDPYDEQTIEIPIELLRRGINYLAVEVHNNSATSSDIYWDAKLDMVESTPIGDGTYFSTDAEIQLPEGSDLNFVAVFGEETDADVLLASGNVPVKVNEVSAGNSVNVNDYFKKDDWIELYNNTADDLNIAGMYLSDDAENPLKFQIPADLDGLNTTLPAHGHLVVWASKRTIIGSAIHTNFKLANADDALVILTAADEAWSDTLRYSAHDGQESFGRYPDGGRQVYRMTLPTIEAPNQLSLYSTFAYTYEYTGVPDPKPEEPDAIGGATMGDVQSVEYINTAGVNMGSNRETLRPGVYVVRYRLTDGSTVVRKQLIR